MLPTIEWKTDCVVMIDQRKLPAPRCTCVQDSLRDGQAIKTMVIRGAPAIGVAAAMGIALGMREEQGDRNEAVRHRVPEDVRSHGRDAADRRQPVLGNRSHEADVRQRRPGRLLGRRKSRTASKPKRSAIHDEDVASCRAMGAHGASLVPETARILTTATPARWPPRATAPRSASSAPPSSRASGWPCWPTKRARSCRAPASPPGS